MMIRSPIVTGYAVEYRTQARNWFQVSTDLSYAKVALLVTILLRSDKGYQFATVKAQF